MKSVWWFTACLAKLCLVTVTLQAQDYSVDWFTIDGGGGASTGGVFSVTGTIGQPDAGTMSGGNYTLTGGFWSIIAAVQTPGAPWLNVLLTPTNTVAIIWPAPGTGWRLEVTPNLATLPVNWTEIPPPYPVVGTNCSYIDLAPAGNKLYRLHKP